MTLTVLGFEISELSASACSDEVLRLIKEGRKGWLACFNPHSYAESIRDKVFRNALHSADWLVADGVGVVIAEKLLYAQGRERVTGSDIFYLLSKRMNDEGQFKVFFLGSTEDTLFDIRSSMAQDFPNIEVVGTYSPPFKPEYTQSELDEMIELINSVRPDVLWVGMTAPKQEKWISENFIKLDVKFAAAVGAVFDFYTGKVKRSHPIFQGLGLEWLPRLVQQPRRLWRRMLISAPIFLRDVFRQKVAQRKARELN